jgi:FSR family fosmidomycin resistance protein-like MFS transporter
LRSEIDKRAMTALSSGHLATDFASGAVPALLPFFVHKWDLSYTLAGLTILAWSVSSAVVQPLFGLFSDRRGALWLVPAGLVAGGVGLGLAALAPSFGVMLALVVVSGLGTAAFHPEASKFAAYVSGRKRASGMSLFSAGGNVGYALGPLAATFLVVHFGLGWGLLLAVPPLLAAAALALVAPYLRSFAPTLEQARAVTGRNEVGGVALLLAVIATRSIAWFGLLAFVPLWEVAHGRTEGYGGKVLAAMLITGWLGTLAVGPAADRYGRRPVLAVTVALVGPLIAFYLLVGGLVGAAGLSLVGACVIGTFGLTTVMSQEYLPRRVALASGLSVGLSIGLGGVAALGLGAIADAAGLQTALWVSAAAPVVGLALCFRLPASRAPLVPEIAAP